MISVITWDAEFRESYHTVTFFQKQDIDHEDFEFIWVDFYSSNERLVDTLNQHPNTKLITLNNSYETPWHLGQCINAGASKASGDLLVIIDGDIAVEHDFLSYVRNSHADQDNLALYFKRYDESQKNSCPESRESIVYLKANTELTNPTNFAGGLTIKKVNYDRVNGFESHGIFSGAGANGLEMNTRLRNAGMAIMWAEDKFIYHPWHPSSGSTQKEKEREALSLARQKFDWIIPYSGLEQSWIIYRRNIKGDIRADEDACNRYIEYTPQIDISYFIDIISRLRKANSAEYLTEIEMNLVSEKFNNDRQDSTVSRSLSGRNRSYLIEEIRLRLLEVDYQNQKLKAELNNFRNKLRMVQESKPSGFKRVMKKIKGFGR